MRLVFLALLLPACHRDKPDEPAPEPTPQHAILVAGTAFPVDARVVRFDQPNGFNAYPHGHFNQRFHRFGYRPDFTDAERAAVADGWSLDQLQAVVDQVVLHYDAARTSANCFRVLNERELSCHFLLDTDGTIYQTLDLQERAWHASDANSRSIGIEIAHPGATPAANPPPPGTIRGSIHGQPFDQPPFTDAQYQALAALLDTLSDALPRIERDYPRNAAGHVVATTLPTADWHAFHGWIGHFHLTENKRDPGPAFDWPRVYAAAND